MFCFGLIWLVCFCFNVYGYVCMCFFLVLFLSLSSFVKLYVCFVCLFVLLHMCMDIGYVMVLLWYLWYDWAVVLYCILFMVFYLLIDWIWLETGVNVKMIWIEWIAANANGMYYVFYIFYFLFFVACVLFMCVLSCVCISF